MDERHDVETAVFPASHARPRTVATLLIVAVVALSGGLGQSQDSSLYVHPSGRVGVGTTTPNEALEVAGVVKAKSFDGGGAVPIGAVVMWSGAGNTVPKGWAICDGNNGTPDLRGRFVLASGQGRHHLPERGNLTNRTAGNKAGEEQHTIALQEMPAHDHGGKTANDGAHTHWFPAWYADTGPLQPTETQKVMMRNNRVPMDPENVRSDGSEHQHAIASSGGGQPFSLMPPYYVLAFIMRIE